MKRAVITLIVFAVLGATGYGYYRYRHATPAPAVATGAVTRGDLVEQVGATGTLQAVTTVQVGTQVSGTIQQIYADFNALVRKGQVLARLDPSLFQTQIAQARANLLRAQADVERLRVALEDARTKAARARELSQRQLLPRSDLDAAEVAVRSAEAQLRSAEAQVIQAEAALNQNEVNLQHTVIESPIDGLVISRNVDVGQTVAASMQAPTLFVLAADLTKMQVVANLDESDVGRIRPGQRVSFRVDAYPAEDFAGSVAQVRLQPIVQQNVVTYATVIDVPNPDLKLKPGMTANVSVEIARRTGVLRIPNAALRFRPTNDTFAALGQAPPAPERTMDGTAGSRSGGATKPVPSAAPTTGMADRGDAESALGRPPARPDVAPGGNTVEARGRRLQLPETQDRTRRARGTPSDGTAEGGGRTGPSPAHAARPAAPPATIDALFGPLPSVETSGRVWTYADGVLHPVRVRLGVTDGQATELLAGEGIDEGTTLVTSIATGNGSTRTTTTPFPGLLGPQPGRFGGPGAGRTGGNRGG
ncbi:MAG: efflux RND transporter periplasmic adaptor subunit [Vicinamibacterales bacterium]